VREAVLDVMIYEEPWAVELLTRVQQGKFVAADVDMGHRDWLIRHGSARVKALADKTVGASSILNREKVVQGYGAIYGLTGDAARGAKVFQQNCTTCHHLANMGNEIGPNLQSVAHWPAEQLVVAILDPSRSAEPRYLSYNCELDTGETVYGLLVTESTAGVVIKGLDAKDRQIPRRQIKSLECTNRSLMPDGLEAAIDKQQMADLIKFVQSQK
jgi:putative heme-binding domain-containing protein